MSRVAIDNGYCKDGSEVNIADIEKNNCGGYGCLGYSDSLTVHTANSEIAGKTYIEIETLEDTVFATLTAADGYTISGVAGLTIPKGFHLSMRVASFSLSSGSVLAWLGA